MEHYLQYCRSSLLELNQFKSVHLVVGNESCDLDSAVSAVVLAYVKHHQLIASNEHNAETSLALPVLNVPRADLKLRREVVFWFEQVLQYNLNNLICRDEIDFKKLDSTKISITLVDHNENREFARLLPKAIFDEILDHHQPTYAEGACQVTDTNQVHIDTSVGSCSSLVALRFLNCNLLSKFGDNEQEINLDSQIALMLYGPILLDTICFNHSAKRFNVNDYEAVTKLEDLLKHSSEAETSLFDRNEVYQRLIDTKNSLNGLTFQEMLRKDMKIVESTSDNNLAICISSLTGTLLTEMSLKDKLGEMKSYCENPPNSAIFSYSRQRVFNALVLMSLDNRIPNNLRRQLSLYCTNKHLMRTIATCIERSELELELITASESLRIYNQNNLTASRKVLLPIISTILNGPGSQRSSDENGKRVEGSDLLLSPPSAPSSLIQQPDSYYGSFIEDSFVGDFVGEYDADNTNYQPLRLDEESQNLVMMNPNDNSCISHTHEIEFDFDSFGPESIIYASNVESNGKASANNGMNNVDGRKEDELIEHDEEEIEHKSSDDSGFDRENINLSTASLDDKLNLNDNASSNHDKIDNSISTNNNSNDNDNDMSEVKEEELNKGVYCHEPDTLVDNNDKSFNNEMKINNPNENDTIIYDIKMENESTPMALLRAQTPISLGTFSRNSTLTKSQRRKILPQANIKNLIITNNATSFSPPPTFDMNSSMLASNTSNELNETISSIGSTGNTTTNGGGVHKDMEENFIISSQQQNENNKNVSLDPLNVSTLSVNHSLNSSGLLRHPSIRKKVPVNYNMILHDQFEDPTKKEESNENKSNQTNNDEVTNDENITNISANDHDSVNERNTPTPPPPQIQFDSINALESPMIDMKVIEPYKAVISHGGYMPSTEQNIESTSPAIIVFNACYLPDRSRRDYNYTMENLFMYVLTTLHNMIADDYILIYLHNGGCVQNSNKSVAPANNMPTFTWLKRSYQMIDRKLKKNLKGLYLVHPTFWLKTLIIMSKPFISSKFSRKLKFVRNLDELKSMIPIENVNIPEAVRIYDNRIKLTRF